MLSICWSKCLETCAPKCWEIWKWMMSGKQSAYHCWEVLWKRWQAVSEEILEMYLWAEGNACSDKHSQPAVDIGVCVELRPQCVEGIVKGVLSSAGRSSIISWKNYSSAWFLLTWCGINLWDSDDHRAFSQVRDFSKIQPQLLSFQKVSVTDAVTKWAIQEQSSDSLQKTWSTLFYPAPGHSWLSADKQIRRLISSMWRLFIQLGQYQCEFDAKWYSHCCKQFRTLWCAVAAVLYKIC